MILLASVGLLLPRLSQVRDLLAKLRTSRYCAKVLSQAFMNAWGWRIQTTARLKLIFVIIPVQGRGSQCYVLTSLNISNAFQKIHIYPLQSIISERGGEGNEPLPQVYIYCRSFGCTRTSRN